MDGLIQFLRNMGAARLAVISMVVFGVIIFFYTILSTVNSASMTTLYADLEPTAASSIAQQLEAENIPYQSNQTGTAIMVPSDRVDQLRLRFASEGLSGGVIGKEIFDGESSFGRTSFELNVNYVRAIEGELSRTIKSIRSVAEARVHVVMPERRPFQREESSPSASILLQTSGALGTRQAQAIQALVASAVPGLSPERITITDTAGRLLADGSGDSEVSSFSDLEEARLQKERVLRSRIEDLIGSVVGRGLVRAEVSLSMDMSRKTTSQTTYDPDTQVVLSSNVSEERSTEGLPGGQTTVANNIPGATGGNTEETSETSRTNEVTNFENSRTETVTVVEPGRITQLQVSVLVDHLRELDEAGNTVGTPTPRPAEEMEQLTALVKTALPAIEDVDGNMIAVPDENITVAQMRFVDPAPIEAIEDPFTILGVHKGFVVEVAKYSVILILGLLFVFLIVRPLVSRLIEAIPEAAPPVDPALEDRSLEPAPAIPAPGSPLPAEVMAAAAAGDENAAALVLAAKESGSMTPGEMRTDARIDVAQVEGRIQESAIKKVAEIIRSNPEESVAIVRGWLYAD